MYRRPHHPKRHPVRAPAPRILVRPVPRKLPPRRGR
jgi:hypothetical protein